MSEVQEPNNPEVSDWFLNINIFIYLLCYVNEFRGSVNIATGYGLDVQGVGIRVLVGSRIFSSSRRPDRHWGPPSLLSNGYRIFLRCDKTGGA
jgi:hypothetical protein